MKKRLLANFTKSEHWSYNLTVFKSCWQKAQFQAVHCLELSIFFSFILPQNQKTFYLEFYFRGYKTDANLFTPFIILYWTEAYLGTRQESAIELFPKIINNSKWLSVRLQTKWLWVRIPLQLLKFQISRLFWARSSLTFRQLQSADSL